MGLGPLVESHLRLVLDGSFEILICLCFTQAHET